MAVLTAIALGTIIAGTVIKARAAKKAAQEQERALEFNAQQAELQADDSVQRGREGEHQLTREVRSLQGSQRAGYAAQGVDVTSGTPGALAASTEGLLQSDLARVRRNAEREALGLTSEAEESRRQGTYARSAGRYNVASSILGGAADATLIAQRQWGGPKGGG